MWVALAIISACCLGVYDIFKKVSVRDNNVVVVLFLNTLFGALFLSPVIVNDLLSGAWRFEQIAWGHLLISIKAMIVLSSWLLGYFAIKHLPLTIQGPINATRPVVVLLGAMFIFGERLNPVQWVGILLGFGSLYLISRIGRREGFSMGRSRWLWMSIGAMMLGAISALYDKYLLRSFEPLQVQAWYTLYQALLMGVIVVVLMRNPLRRGDKFTWRWTIPFIALFLTVADVAYFYSLSMPDSMVSIVSMLRRGSVIISFLFGVIVLREKNVKIKVIDLCVLLVSLILLVVGSTL